MLEVIVTTEKETYCAGELVRGTIKTPAGPEHLYTLKTHLVAREKIRCPETNDNPAFAESYPFLKIPITPILNENPDDPSDSDLWQFEVELPKSSCVASFNFTSKSGYFATIEYLIHVRLFKGNERVHSTETTFGVVELPISKLHPQNCSTSKSLLFPPKKVTMTANLPRQGYAVGECIPIRLSIENESAREIKTLIIYLSRTLLFQLKQTTAKLSQKVKTISHDLVGKNSLRDEEFELPISGTLPASVNGKLVSLQYQVGILAVIPGAVGMTTEVQMQMPVILCDKRAFDKIPLEIHPVPNNQEFSVPENAGEVNFSPHQEELRKLEDTKPLTGTLFYKTSQMYYYDILKSNLRQSTLEILAVSNQSISVKARIHQRPSMFAYDVAALESPPNTYKIHLNRYSSPALATGRWYIEVTGTRFMKTSDYQISVKMGTLPEANTDKEIVVEEIYEHQKRSTPFSHYSGVGLTAPGNWTSLDGLSVPEKDNYPLPNAENWYWRTSWIPVVNSSTDHDGWEYARTWTSGWRPDNTAVCFVRRRKWTRTRALKTAEIRELEQSARPDIELELEELCNEFELLDTLNSPSAPNLPMIGAKRLSKPSVPEDLPDDFEPARNSFPDEPQPEKPKPADEPQDRLSFELYTSGDFSVGFAESSDDHDVVDQAFLPPGEESLLDDEEDECPLHFITPVNASEIIRELSKSIEPIVIEKKEPPVFEEPSRLSGSLDASILWDREQIRQMEREQESQRLQKEQEERAEASRKQREAERKQQEAEWAARELALTKQLEEDRKRLEMLSNNSALFAHFEEAKNQARAQVEQEEVQPPPPAPEPETPPAEISNSVYLDEETDPGFEEFEPISDSDSE